jgi:hypothetical protein
MVLNIPGSVVVVVAHPVMMVMMSTQTHATIVLIENVCALCANDHGWGLCVGDSGVDGNDDVFCMASVGCVGRWW